MNKEQYMILAVDGDEELCIGPFSQRYIAQKYINEDPDPEIRTSMRIVVLINPAWMDKSATNKA